MRTLQNTFSFTLCAALLIGGVPGFAAAQTESPAPATPATPPAASTATDGTAVMTAHTVLVDPATTATATAKATGKDWSQVYDLTSHVKLSNTRVNVDKKNAKVKDVLKAMFDQAKIGYFFDADVPDGAYISIKLDNVTIATALDALTQSAGMQWQISVERAGRTGNALVHVSNKPAVTQSAFPPDGIIWDSWTFVPYKPYTPENSAVKLLHEMQTNTDDFFHSTGKPVMPYTNYTSVTHSQETRSTFTCPNCHNQVTILRKNVDAKCATCGRALESDWKVCPFDGTKRPIAKDDWKFCPICGKAIPEGVATLFSVPTLEAASPQYYAYQPRLNFTPLTTPFWPSGTLRLIQPPTTPVPMLPVIHPPAGDYK